MGAWITCACKLNVIMIVASLACAFTSKTWHHMDLKLNTMAIAATLRLYISQNNTGISTMWTYQEKSCYTVNKVPLTKSRLNCELLLSPATTDYSRSLKIQLAGFLNLHIQNALDSNHFPLFWILGLQIGRGKKVKFRRIFRDRFTEKSADFAGIFRANVTENQSVKNGWLCNNFLANFTSNW